MSVQIIAIVVFTLILSAILYKNRKKLALQKILFPFIYIVIYRTQLGLNSMNRVAASYRKLLGILGYLAIITGFLGMALICYFLVDNIVSLLTTPTAAPGVALVLPFKVKGGLYVPFIYWIISIFILAAVHEFSHGVMARLAGVRVKSSGLAFISLLLPVIPAAFVEPDEKGLRKRPPKDQLAVFAAGPFSNLVCGFLLIWVFILLVIPISNAFIDLNGVAIAGFDGNESITYPAEKAGMSKGEIIKAVDNADILSVENFTSALSGKHSGDIVGIRTDRGSYEVSLAENPSNQSAGYLGVYIQQSSEIRKSARARLWFIPNLAIWLLGLVYWLYVLNLGIGLFNLAPLGVVDGGRMLQILLSCILPGKPGQRLWGLISMLFLSLVVINIVFSFAR
ncbi:hypothetical protein AUJ69_03950 [Candidatus Woesearchaeota archaeon CG1_02_47_18]|nr:MAG: hypothetical protein AUJ69_03950 [Candidatus Woesearchaeota archaeon CG1_02_47_18]HII30006.1 hypothetical protein [Candidatus Woesearchaeota archaeon]